MAEQRAVLIENSSWIADQVYGADGTEYDVDLETVYEQYGFSPSGPGSEEHFYSLFAPGELVILELVSLPAQYEVWRLVSEPAEKEQ